jgi:leucine dehydrogenase
VGSRQSAATKPVLFGRLKPPFHRDSPWPARADATPVTKDVPARCDSTRRSRVCAASPGDLAARVRRGAHAILAGVRWHLSGGLGEGRRGWSGNESSRGRAGGEASPERPDKRRRLPVDASFEDLLRSWDGEQALIRFDRPTGTWMFVCVHSTARGPAGGGTRLQTYHAPAEGLADAMGLSAAMSRKMAVLEAPFGGGKAVLAVPELPTAETRRGLMLRYGDMVASLGGTFRTAADLNISSADLDVVAERCAYVYGRSEEHGGAGDSGPGTARGVFHGIRASLAHVFGTADLSGRKVLVQGVGSVGRPLAGLLAEAGAAVLVSDLAAERAQKAARAVGGVVIAADRALEAECDVYAPCAAGGQLSAESIPRLRCRIVAGSANNQLATSADARRLRDAGILYAPDYVINAGGVLQLLGLEDLGWDELTLEEHLAAIGATLRRIYTEADSDGITTAAAADRLAGQRLSSAG